MKRTYSQSRQAMIALVAVLTAGGACGSDRTPADTPAVTPVGSSAAATPVGSSAAVMPDTSRAAILREAESLYTYDRDERPPLSRNDKDFKGPVVDDSMVPQVRIATARLKDPSRRPRYRIIARINSDAPYDSLGLGKGYSYVWRNSWDDAQADTWVTKIIASDSTRPEHVLVRDPRYIAYSHGNAREPRLVRIKVHSLALGICVDDPRCGGHCGYY